MGDIENFSDALKSGLAQLKDSPYKILEVSTASGSFSGEVVSLSKGVLVLVSKTGNMNMDLNREQLSVTSVDVNTITAISICVLSD